MPMVMPKCMTQPSLKWRVLLFKCKQIPTHHHLQADNRDLPSSDKGNVSLKIGHPVWLQTDKWTSCLTADRRMVYEEEFLWSELNCDQWTQSKNGNELHENE